MLYLEGMEQEKIKLFLSDIWENFTGYAVVAFLVVGLILMLATIMITGKAPQLEQGDCEPGAEYNCR